MIKIIQGEQQPFTIDLKSAETGKPFDLTGYSEITVCFKAGSSLVSKDTSSGVSVVGDPMLGQISGTLEVADTSSLTSTASGSIEVTIDFGGGNIKKTQILNEFSVSQTLCS